MAAALVGCSTAPGNSKQQGAVVGGASGAAVGAAVSKNNRALGAVIGGAVGAAGGYVVGGKTGPLDKRESKDNSASTASRTTADANKDGFVTLDEIADMEKSGVTDDEMIRRIEATGLTFDLNDEQRKFLAEKGVSAVVIDRLPTLNRGATPAVNPAPSGSAVISK